MTTTEAPLPPVHPGEILREDFLADIGVSAYRLAKATGMPIQRVSAIVNGKRSVTADTALRLGRFFGVDPQWWMNMQSHYELERAKATLGDALDAVIPFAKASEGHNGPTLRPKSRPELIAHFTSFEPRHRHWATATHPVPVQRSRSQAIATKLDGAAEFVKAPGVEGQRVQLSQPRRDGIRDLFNGPLSRAIREV